MQPESSVYIGEPEKMQWGPTLFLNYPVYTKSSTGVMTLSIDRFREYRGWPVYEELSDRLTETDKVVNIQNFFPYGVVSKEEERRQGLGRMLMEDVVLPDATDYNASMIYCNTRNRGMKELLNKFDFAEMSYFEYDVWNEVWKPFYKLL